MSHWVFFPSIDIEPLLPTAFDLCELVAVWGSALLLLSLGRLLTRGQGFPELQLLAGWGVLALVLTAWGALMPSVYPLWWPAAGVAAAGVVGLLIPAVNPRREDWIALGRVLALSLPFWAVLASERPSQPDTFLNLLPNAAYLYDHGFLPAADRPESHSFLPGAPYNLQFWAYLVGIAVPRFPAVAMAHINLVLYLAFGLLLARVLQFAPVLDERGSRAPAWCATALGLLLATALNPGFVPRVALTVYGETSISVCLGAAGFLVARGFERIATQTTLRPTLVLFAATLVALVGIKQESVAFVIALAVSIPFLGLLDRQVGFARASMAFAPAFAPAVLLYLLWRLYVHSRLSGGELGLLPYEQWNWQLLPQILRAVGLIVAGKGFYFGLLLIALLLLLWRLRRRRFEFATRLLTLTVAVAVAYDLFLLIAYVASFTPRMAADAHSFFRYNTHLSLLLVLSLASLCRTLLTERSRPLGVGWRVAARLAVVAMLVFPVAFIGRLRFDLMPPQPLIRALAQDVAPFIGSDEKLALILPGDGGGIATMMEGVLRYETPRRPGVDLVTVSRIDDATLSGLAQQGVTKVLISCVTDGSPDLPRGHAVLLERSGTEWRRIAAWRYPVRDNRRWDASLPATSLCS
ncbi:MAG TPA: hypothetical protein VLX09_05485 [Stellaceae bacterium]|nr:hypothetical protein [Stellaceae bacterium]